MQGTNPSVEPREVAINRGMWRVQGSLEEAALTRGSPCHLELLAVYGKLRGSRGLRSGGGTSEPRDAGSRQTESSIVMSKKVFRSQEVFNFLRKCLAIGLS